MTPAYLSESLSGIIPAVANHLWQSTLFAAVAALLTLALRKNPARTRYWLWLAASMKFLIPFSLLVSLGAYFQRPRSLETQPAFYSAMNQISRPFPYAPIPAISAPASPSAYLALAHLLPEILLLVWLCGFFTLLCAWYLRWRRLSIVMRDTVSLRAGREVEALRRMESAIGIRRPVKLLLSPASLEPGVFGVVRPVLLWPADFSAHLTDAHLEAILAHELWHVRRRDNMAAAMHMLVEAIFWFHPLVWWIGARLVEERERACDEEVLQLGNAPRVYAESILKTCEFCVESPLKCISGVTGADLRKRVMNIMTKRPAIRLKFTKKLLLTAAGIIAVGAPFVFGLMTTGQSKIDSDSTNQDANLPSYDVVSVRPSKNADWDFNNTPDGFTATGASLLMLIRDAYGFIQFTNDRISGAPAWARTDRYDIEAKVDSADVAALETLSQSQRVSQRERMLQMLLADRFKLKIHVQTRDLPVYTLVVARGGPKLTEAKPGEAYPKGSRAGMMRLGHGVLIGQAIPIAALANMLRQQQGDLGGRSVLDRTGLTKKYDITLRWTPESSAAPFNGAAGNRASLTTQTADDSGPSIFTALQEQLGLKLEPAKGPVETLVVDHVERPAPN